MESKIDAASTAFIWLYSHTGFGSWTLDNGDFTINDGGTTTKPIVKVTSQTSDHTNMSAPQIRRLKIHKYTGTFNGNVVEDFWQTVPRNGTFQGKTITDMTLLHYYDGNIVSWANSNAVQDLYQRGGPPPSPFLQATYGPSITFDMSVAEMYYINVTDNNAFTINAPTNPVTGQSLYVFIKNQTTAMGAVTWNAAFKMAGAWANPSATGRFRTIHFKYQGGAWYEFGRSPVDVL
jgi:hypothetical protein